MSQYLRPISTVTAGSWTTSSASLHDAIDEGIDNADDDASYASESIENDDLEVKLSAGIDPLTDTLHVMYWRARRFGFYLLPVSSQAQLYQGSTLIATGTGSHSDTIVGASKYTTASYTLTEAEASAITDYTDLRLRIRYTASIGTASMRLTAAELVIPSIDTRASQKATIAAPEVLGQVAQPIARGQSVEAC